MRITVHRGTNQIGGTCVELEHEGRSILLDMGSPLSEGSAPIDTSTLHPDALLVSHVHQDHYGLMSQLDESVPVFMTELGKRLIDATSLFLGRDPIQRDIRFFVPWEPFEVAGFRITPHLVDHSTPDAFGFLVEAGGARVFYTGDFRAHGRKSKLFAKQLTNLPKGLDAVIMEGTMLRRDNDEFPDEESVEAAIHKAIVDQTNMSFLICSSQNIDRIVSAYRACLRAEKTLVVDLYTAWVLEQLKLVSDSVPNMSWERMRVYFPYHQYQVVRQHAGYFDGFLKRALARRIEKEEIAEQPTRFLYLAKMSSRPIVDRYKQSGPVRVVYSQWLGYLEEDASPALPSRSIAGLRDDPEVEFTYAHTSGHAVLEDLQTFVQGLSPKRLIPIHTEFADDFANHFGNVVRLRDGEPLDLS